MKWRDLLYFSKGERRALTVLLCLIAAAWLTLMWTDNPQTGNIKTMNSSLPSKQSSSSYPSNNPAKSNQTPSKLHLGGNQIPSTGKSNFTRREFKSQKTLYPRSEKYPEGTIVELNTADTTVLKKVPGIGSAFARRIIKYRDLLGGFYTVEQLSEVYGIDEERFASLRSWFSADPSVIHPIRVNRICPDSLPYHPYLSFPQKRTLIKLLKQKGQLAGWENLQLLEEFTSEDKARLGPYLSFE